MKKVTAISLTFSIFAVFGQCVVDHYPDTGHCCQCFHFCD